MGFNRYNIGFLVRVFLLTIFIGLFLFFLLIQREYVRSIYVFVVVCFIMRNIFLYTSRISRDLYTFISALANEEYSIQFSEDKRDKNFKMLYHLYNTTAERFQKVKYERDLQHVFLKEIVNQIEVGILAFDKFEKIQLINRTYTELFQCKKPQVLSDLDPKIYSILKEITPGSRKLIYYSIGDEKLVLSAHSTSFVLKEKSIILVYFHNIKTEMDEQEIESWQKLFSVLTHEIMNSVTPISSLSSSLNSKLKRDIKELGTAEPKTLNTLSEGLEAVTLRTKGLLTFTESFRKLSKVPKPKVVEIELEKLFERIKTLFSTTIQAKEIHFSYSVSNEASLIFADPQQIEQVFINLVQNSIDSLCLNSQGKIRLESFRNPEGKTEVSISDNGIGISVETLEKVFIPFFTTKEKGNGIGLSLSRQIVRMHGGSIDIKSVPNEGTLVTIKL